MHTGPRLALPFPMSLWGKYKIYGLWGDCNKSGMRSWVYNRQFHDNVSLVVKKAHWLLGIIRKDVGKNTENKFYHYKSVVSPIDFCSQKTCRRFRKYPEKDKSGQSEEVDLTHTSNYTVKILHHKMLWNLTFHTGSNENWTSYWKTNTWRLLKIWKITSDPGALQAANSGKLERI